MEQCASWEDNRFSVSQEIPPHFMEPEGSLPHSQVPATCPYPEHNVDSTFVLPLQVLESGCTFRDSSWFSRFS